MQTKLTLNDGNVIPQFGLGLYQLPEGTETQNIVKTALEIRLSSSGYGTRLSK